VTSGANQSFNNQLQFQIRNGDSAFNRRHRIDVHGVCRRIPDDSSYIEGGAEAHPSLLSIVLELELVLVLDL
jgi:hypothetical protein